jgi:prepilin-type N-terminal cleavage/methylation domain-containing protein
MFLHRNTANVKQHFVAMKNPILKSSAPKLGLRKGFTLVEILVVVAIISILMTAGITGLGNLSAGKGTATAVASCEALFAEARGLAMSKGCRARVLIDRNNASNDNYLRRVVVVHEQLDANGNPINNSWVMASRGYVMPQGTYFSNVASTGQAVVALGGGSIKPAYVGNYVFYEFNAEGISTIPGSNFVVGTGVRAPGTEPRATAGTGRDFGGFTIFRNGTSAIFRNPSQITSLPAGTNFNF